jgi:hypothetical protein
MGNFAPLSFGGNMQGEKRTCKRCGHDCHCYQPSCEKCINDVCTQCDCKSEIPDSFFKRN